MAATPVPLTDWYDDTITRSSPTASAMGFSATTSGAATQFGFAMIP